MKRFASISSLCLLAACASAQITFTFDDAGIHSGLHSLTESGLTANFTATGEGFSFQAADALGWTPSGFSGLCIYPNSIYIADLIIDFSAPITDFSLTYATEEYGSDSAATMRATATLGGSFVGTNTAIAPIPGTWPTGVLTYSNASGFDKVVVHYDAFPVNGENYGPVFMADNMIVTPQVVPEPLSLIALGAGFVLLARRRKVSIGS